MQETSGENPVWGCPRMLLWMVLMGIGVAAIFAEAFDWQWFALIVAGLAIISLDNIAYELKRIGKLLKRGDASDGKRI